MALSLAGARRSVCDICSHFLCHGDAATIITHIIQCLVNAEAICSANYSAPVTGTLFEAQRTQSIDQRTSCVHYTAIRSQLGAALHRVPRIHLTPHFKVFRIKQVRSTLTVTCSWKSENLKDISCKKISTFSSTSNHTKESLCAS